MFTFHILSDTEVRSGVLPAQDQITTKDFYDFIESENYGSDLNGIAIILMCREPDVVFKKRLRLSKKEKVLYMDIMLDYDQFVGMTVEQRIAEICNAVLFELPQVFKKYKFKCFDSDKFVANLESWFVNHKYI